jgi:sugar phosphate isomerase/epimerase
MPIGRREFLELAMAQAGAGGATQFQIACMTLPYAAFPMRRALEGIRAAGFEYVAWGVNHKEADGRVRPALDVTATAPQARALARQCQDMGLKPIMIFATVHLEARNALDVHRRRIEQSQAAEIPFLLTFGKTSPGEREAFVENLRRIGPEAAAAGVTVVIKQHGGNTATGSDCSKIIAEVNHVAVKMCYDAGNVLDYENQDPIADIGNCWRDIRAFAIKDHRNFPKDEDCGPGFGEIDHYKLLAPMMRTGLTMPLACENIFEPLVPRPSAPEGIDALARRAREYVETVLRGLRAQKEKA